MTPGRNLVRIAAAVVVALAAWLAAVQPAAAEPLLTIASPSSGTVTNEQRPPFTGTTDDPFDPVTLNVYLTPEAGGSLVASSQTEPEGSGEWTTKPPFDLKDGRYVAVAEQTSTLLSETSTSEPVEFTVDTAPPTVSLNSVSSPTKDNTPSFSGSASDTTSVTVYIFKGSSAEGSSVATAHASGTGGGWSSGAASPALADGTYTAVAEQESSLGNGPGFSQERTFTVNTAPPTVSLNSVSSPTKDNTPSFSGSASDTTSVTVYIFKGSSAEGSSVATAHASGTGGGWSSGAASPALADGTYTAVAEQESSLGNGPGFSQERTFTVNTAPPTVSLNSVSSPTKDNTPSFSGSASDTTSVTVYVFKGGSASGSPVATAHASGTGGGWSSGAASPALADGTYTAVAEQESSLGNGPGFSQERTFTVNTAPPSVSLNAVSSPTNDNTPSFTGFASDTTTVTVYIFKGGSASGSPVATAHASGTGGAWTSGEASPALADGSYTAVAVQESSLGNGEGSSEAIHFTVLTAAPTVTLNSVSSPTGNTTPSFSGFASDTTPVTIQIYAGPTAEGTVVATAAATGTGGSWTSGHLSPALASGKYTAVAEQSSSLLGNPAGVSNSVTFVIDTSSPTVTLNAVPSPSNNATPTFSGSASDSTSVVVHVFDGANHEVAFSSGTPSKGAWKSGGLSKALTSGSYTAVASQASSLGNPEGMSAPVSFVVNTQAPSVTLNQPASRSSDTTPSFSGTASDTTTVTVQIYQGSSVKGSPVSSATAEGTGGGWASSPASPAIPSGTYTAIAVQKSSLGNPDGLSEPKTFEVDTNAPAVTLTPPKSPSNNRTPSFSGTASGRAQVVVHVVEGSTEVAQLTAIPSAGSWSTGPLGSPLPAGRHEYKVYATEVSLIGNPEGKSEELPMVLDTTSPVVTLAAIPALSKNTTPSFKGTASDTESVNVSIYPGSLTTGTPVATATGPVTAGAWTSGTASPALANGIYTAVARQPSSLGNPAGGSNSISFAVNTDPPTVTIEPIVTPSNKREPSFSGTASDTTPVVVHVLLAGGGEVASAQAKPSAGKWKAGPITPALASGAYTAYATEASSLENLDGKSGEVSFVVNTEPPKVTLNPVATPSNNREPSFSGTASETGQVKVEITSSGKKWEATAAVSKGEWTTGPVTLPLETHTYTAVATQNSSIENPPGKSEPIKFVIDPKAPTISMSPPRAQINTATPSFSGLASGSTPVIVAICRLSTPCKAEAGEWTAKSAGGGAWTATLGSALPDGEYQAIASEKSFVGDVGATREYLFTIDTAAPAIALSSPSNGAVSHGGSQLVAGTAGTAAHDLHSVTVQLFAGSSISAGQTPVQIVSVGTGGAGWSAILGGLSLGTYTVRAIQSDEAGNVGTSATSTFVEQATTPPSAGPTAAFSWYPSNPHTGEQVSLVSSSTDGTSPITAYSWNLLGSAFTAGGQTQTTSFAAPGSHLVQLRVTDSAGLTSLASQRIPVTYPVMRPFPLVRIVTTRSAGRVRLKLLSVQAPAGASVKVTCTGKRCPLRSQAKVVPNAKAKSSGAQSISFGRFQRSLAPGVVLDIRIAKAGQIGKFTRFAVRKGKLPVRADACLNSTETKPEACPS